MVFASGDKAAVIAAAAAVANDDCDGRFRRIAQRLLSEKLLPRIRELSIGAFARSR